MIGKVYLSIEFEASLFSGFTICLVKRSAFFSLISM